MLKAGHCTQCATPIWRVATDPNTQQPVLLWPDPKSFYVTVLIAERGGVTRESPGHTTPGIGYCFPCCPEIGESAGPEILVSVPNALHIAEIESAAGRYANWYQPAFGEWLRAHARDYLKLDDVAITTLLDQWEKDRA